LFFVQLMIVRFFRMFIVTWKAGQLSIFNILMEGLVVMTKKIKVKRKKLKCDDD